MWANTIELADPYNATINVWGKLCLWLGKTHEPQYIPYQFQMDKSWSIRAGTRSALENLPFYCTPV